MKTYVWFFALLIAFLIIYGETAMGQGDRSKTESSYRIGLPEPRLESNLSTEEALLKRRSVREYGKKPLSLQEVSQLLWAAQGITGGYGMRTAPSAGALYPLELYLVAGHVNELAAGIYRYRSKGHDLLKLAEGDKRRELYLASLEQEAVRDGAAAIVIAAVYGRTTIKYGKRGLRYVHMEVGSVAQNIYLQAVTLKVGTVFIGAFDDAKVKRVINMPDGEEPLAIMPLGRK
jgi:SagB-type dehydrogenase family enzyme